MDDVKQLIETCRDELSAKGMSVIPNHDMENVVRIFSNCFIDEWHVSYFNDKLKGHDIEIRTVNPQVIDIVKAKKRMG